MSGWENKVPSVACSKCGKEFRPYGDLPQEPPVYGIYECPYCHNKITIIWDKELQRDTYRKKAGLTGDSDRVQQLTAENQELKKRMDALETQNEILTKEMEEAVSNFLLFVRKYGPMLDSMEKEYKTIIKKPKGGRNDRFVR